MLAYLLQIIQDAIVASRRISWTYLDEAKSRRSIELFRWTDPLVHSGVVGLGVSSFMAMRWLGLD